MKNLVRMFIVLSIVAFTTACSPKQEATDVTTADTTQVDTLVTPADSTTVAE